MKEPRDSACHPIILDQRCVKLPLVFCLHFRLYPLIFSLSPPICYTTPFVFQHHKHHRMECPRQVTRNRALNVAGGLARAPRRPRHDVDGLNDADIPHIKSTPTTRLRRNLV